MRMRAVFDCSADDAGELSFKEGDILVDVVNSSEDGWYSGRLENTSETGLFPYNYVERIFETIATNELTETPESTSPKSLNTPPSTTKNIPVATRSVNITEQLPGFPALDAFEAAMGGKKTNSNSWNSTTLSSTPPALSPKPIVSNVNHKPIASEKPQLKTFGIKKEDSPTRLRSYSTSSLSSNTENKPLKPSQLINGKGGTKSALEVALSKGSPGVRVQSKLRSNSLSKSSSNPGGSFGNGVPLVGMANLKLNNSISTDLEEEDGYQMVKPSQLRQRQQQQQPNPVISKSSASLSSYKKPVNTWKSPAITKPISPKPANSTSSSDKLTNVPISTSPMPRLPSRPVSTASRRSRNSRNNSLNSSPSTSSNSTPVATKLNLPVVKETTNTGPPILKPKPVMKTQPHRGTLNDKTSDDKPHNKARSSSNPPPLQPKPAAMSSIEVLLSKNVNKEKPIVQPKPQYTKKPEDWRSADTDESNIRPSTLLNRNRSSTNPLSPTIINETRNVAPVSPVKKKMAPPPPPPSRPVKNKSHVMDEASKHRYEILFETIHDNGYVDGETARFIWLKSKLSTEDLSRVWKECADQKGLLDKYAFIDGMGEN